MILMQNGSSGTETRELFGDRSRRAKSPSRPLMLLVWMGLLCLPGCSGCQQSPEKSSTSKTEPEPPMTENTVKTESTRASETEQPRPEDASSAEVQQPVTKSESTQVPAKANSTATTLAEKSRSEPAKQMTPESAYATARALRDQASRASDRKDYGAAFDLTSRAWDAARKFPQDVRLKKMTEELASELESLGEQANAKSSSRAKDSATTLIEK